MPTLFLSYRRKDTGVIAGRVADHLRSCFGPDAVYMDIESIPPGVDFREHLKSAVLRSRVVLVLIGDRWVELDDRGKRRLDDPDDFVRFELEAALAHGKPIVPVLVDRASMPPAESLPVDLAEIAYKNAFALDSGRDFSTHIDRLIDELSKLGLPPKPVPVPTDQRDRRNRKVLLEEVKREAASRLDQALHQTATIDLGMHEEPLQVEHPWDAEVKFGEQPSKALAPSVGAIDVFDRPTVDGKLLILGEPGSGKTTTLLELARKLAARADTDADRSVPVILSLSTWKAGQMSFPDWVAAQLGRKYGVRKDIAVQWLNESRLSLLLDGLDEVAPTHQPRCIQAINEFLSSCQPPQLAVSCRRAEYLALNTKLQLNGAIGLQALTDEQVCDYVTSLGHRDLWDQLRADPGFAELARSPLFLGMLVAAQQSGALRGWQQGERAAESREQLLESYVAQAISRRASERTDWYSDESARAWLTWLAQQLRQRNESEFLLEQLQPTWLSSSTQRWTYRVAVVLFVALIFGLVMGLTGWLIPSSPAAKAVLQEYGRPAAESQQGAWEAAAFLLLTGIGLVAGSLVAGKARITPVETIRWSWRRAGQGAVASLGSPFATVLMEYSFYVLVAVFTVYGGLHWFPTPQAVHIPGDRARFWFMAAVLMALVALISMLLVVRAAISTLRVAKHDSRLRTAVRARLSECVFEAAISSLLTILWGTFLDFGLLVGTAAAVSAALLSGAGRLTERQPAFRLSDALIVALIASVAAGWLTWLYGVVIFGSLPQNSSWATWIAPCMTGSIGIALSAAQIAWLVAPKTGYGSNNVWFFSRASITAWVTQRWRWWFAIAALTSLLWSSALAVLLGTGRLKLFAEIVIGWLYVGSAGFTPLLSLSLLLMNVSSIALASVLFGLVKGGLTGPDINQRMFPNQGIWQSALNTALFALAGAVLIGTIMALVNIAAAATQAGTVPEKSDWIAVGATNGIFWGCLCALVPGAACVQHWVLRFVLWQHGVTPWRYVRFLDYATSRMVLQRVGGHYRFIHHLVRDHLASTGVAPDTSRKSKVVERSGRAGGPHSDPEPAPSRPA